MVATFLYHLIRIAVSLFPAFIFLIVLIFLDSFKLVKLRSVILTIILGCIISGICFVINSVGLQALALDFSTYSRYIAPIIEELFKAIYIVYLIRSNNIGFMVDGAIFGFAIGAGFAFIENIYYLQSLTNVSLFVWIIRGFGTAIMHAGTTATFAIISKNLADRKSMEKIHIFLPALAVSVIFHSFFNHFFLHPLIFTVINLSVLPLVLIIIFNQSEKGTRNWLGIGFDTDQELLNMITGGNIVETKIGKYLSSLKRRFPGEIIADMLCLLRIHLELSIRAKGILLMREAGFKIEIAPDIKETFDELKYLEKSLGKTGLMAISPLLHTSSRDLWELHMLGQ